MTGRYHYELPVVIWCLLQSISLLHNLIGMPIIFSCEARFCHTYGARKLAVGDIRKLVPISTRAVNASSMHQCLYYRDQESSESCSRGARALPYFKALSPPYVSHKPPIYYLSPPCHPPPSPPPIIIKTSSHTPACYRCLQQRQ
jgi:hypothetical protein